VYPTSYVLAIANITCARCLDGAKRGARGCRDSGVVTPKGERTRQNGPTPNPSILVGGIVGPRQGVRPGRLHLPARSHRRLASESTQSPAAGRAAAWILARWVEPECCLCDRRPEQQTCGNSLQQHAGLYNLI
jgi:hypothetical protein